MTKDDAMTRVESMLSNLPPMPAELAQQAHEMTEQELQEFVTRVATGQLHRLYEMTQRMQERCGVCRDSGNTCAHCMADFLVLQELLKETVLMAAFARAAVAPGTRIAAQREAAQEKTPTDV